MTNYDAIDKNIINDNDGSSDDNSDDLNIKSV